MTALAFLAALAAAPSFNPAPPPVPVANVNGPYAKAEVVLDWKGIPTRVRLLVVGERAGLEGLPAGKAQWMRPIATPDDALAVLADRKLEPLWPALLAWAGPDLGLFRDRYVADYRRNFERRSPADSLSSGEMLARPRARALQQYAEALWRTGKAAEANALLRAELDRSRPRKLGVYRSQDLTLIGLKLALQTRRSGDAPGALAIVDGLIGSGLGKDPYDRLNLDVNRAAYLAESGRHAEALALIDRALAAYAAQRKDDEINKVAGSNRHFAWIRACALKGLGRQDEARAEWATVVGSGEVRDEELPVTSTESILVRGLVCMQDVEGAARQLAAGLEHEVGGLGSPVLLYAQTEGAWRDMFGDAISAVLETPVMRAALESRARALAPAFAPALRHWRPAPAPAS